MKRKVTALLSAMAIAASLGVLSPTASAKSVTKAAAKSAKKQKRMVFKTPDQIIGALVGPDGEWLSGKPKPDPGSLLEYRFDFNDMMVRDLKNL